jgi:hypothetical protein
LHCTIEPGNGERTLRRAAGLDRHPARNPRDAAFAQVFGRFFDIRLGPGRRTLAKTGAKKQNRPSRVVNGRQSSWRATQITSA